MPWTTIDDRVTELLPRLRELRHDLHRHPELGFEEHRTQGVVRAWLEEHGYAPRDCAETGLVADLRPDAEGPTVALRADLDALPIHERTDLPYRSVHDGVAHKCGHDGHTTILLGLAAVVAPLRDRVPGNLRLLFQPAEEGVRGGGARVMVEQGALDGVREVYGLHNWPGFPKGQLRVVAGPTMAEVCTFRLTLRGRGGHGSQPHLCRDPIAAGVQIAGSLNTIVARNLAHDQRGVLSVCSFRAGSAPNVIPGQADLSGTVRFFDEEVGARILRRLEEIVTGTAKAMGVDADLSIERQYPVLVNDPTCAGAVERVAGELLGPELVSSDELPMCASEDFAFMARAAPGAYFFLGAGRGADRETPGCHHPDFDFDDDLIATGVRVFAGIARDRLTALASG